VQNLSARVPALLLAVGVLAGATACGGASNGKSGAGSTPTAARPTRTTLGLSSSAFLNGSSIPAHYTCDGENVSPPLTWTRVPVRARSLVLLVEDRDASGGEFVHWSLYDLPRGSSGLSSGRVPAGGVEGENSYGRTGYSGPCPPTGDPAHHYVFSLYALDNRPELPPGASPGSVREVIAAHSITTGTLTGLYRR
jgi:Raf kinase inhibitor-like YbhB/YbcL family protein